MDDVYGNRVAAFRTLLERSLQSGTLGWAKIHFHSIGKGCASSEEHFRAVLDAAKEREAHLWIAGLADAYKYLTERRGATLAIKNDGPHCVRLQLSCSTTADLFDQPLTIEAILPEDWGKARVHAHDSGGEPVDRGIATQSQNRLLRFHVPPVDSEYSIQRESLR